MTNAMVCALLIAQSGSVGILPSALIWFGRGAPGGPWRKRVEETTWRSHLTLPVVRPERVEARQCGGSAASIYSDIDYFVRYSTRGTLEKAGIIDRTLL